MNLSKQIAKQLRSLYFGKNWTAVSYKEVLENISWVQANKKVGDFNSILTLVHHTMYYMKVQLPVMNGGELVASDKESFIHPPIRSEQEWQDLLKEMYALVETYATKIESLPEHIFDKPMADEKYGNYYRNLHGVIEHSHYHLGQIVLLKRGLRVTI